MKEKKYKKCIEDAIAPFGATLLEFEYSRKFFGNMIATIYDSNHKLHEYVLDRGIVFIGNECFPLFVGREAGKKNQPFDEFLKHILRDLTKFSG